MKKTPAAPARKKELVTGGDPEAKFTLPSMDDWADEDYIIAKPLADIGEALIANRNEFKHLAGAKIFYVFKRKGPTAPRMKLGTCQRPSGLLAFFTKADFVITLMANNCFDRSRWQIEAIIYHELKHAGVAPNGEYVTVPHDCECFAAEISHYGLWKTDLEAIAKAGERALQLPFDEPAPPAVVDGAQPKLTEGEARP